MPDTWSLASVYGTARVHASFRIRKRQGLAPDGAYKAQNLPTRTIQVKLASHAYSVLRASTLLAKQGIVGLQSMLFASHRLIGLFVGTTASGYPRRYQHVVSSMACALHVPDCPQPLLTSTLTKDITLQSHACT